jgi:DNA-binding ferritin-like protein (Dps family)
MNLTKKISFILIVSILSINLSFLVSPQKTNATGLPVVDIVGNALKGSKDIWDVLGKAGMELLSIATKSLARMLINEITNETVKWIGGLGDENNPPPSYVDIPKFLLKVEDRAIGDYIANNPNLDFLCDPFKNQIKIALGLNVGNPGHLFEGSDCSLTQISNNVRNSVNGGVDFQASLNLTADNKSATLNSTFSPPNDFSSSGGWDSWLALTTVPQNNIQGAYLIAQSDMNLNIQSAKGSKEIDIANGSGALSLRTCVDRYEDGNGNSYGTPSDQYFEGTQAPPPPSGGGTPVYGADEQGHGTVSYKGGVNVKTITDCTTKTPGRIVSSMLEKSVNADKNTTEMLAALGDGIDAIFNALTSKLFDVAMEQLKNGIFGDSTQRDNMNASIMEAASAESQRVQDQMNNDIQTFRDAYNTDGTQESLNALAFTMATYRSGTGGTGTTSGSTGGTGEVSTGEFTANIGDNL